MAHYDTYKTRRVRVRQQVIDGIKAKYSRPSDRALAGQALAAARLHALRELMLMEIPDRWSDITLTGSGPPRYPYFLDVSETGVGRTALSAIYLRRYQQIAATADPAALVNNQGAECLYLVITLACGDGEARSQFGEDSIGDTDGDGAFEFLDGWGRPIDFLRWAPGFESVVQINANTLGTTPANNPAWMSAASGDHDPFDIYRVDPPAFRLVPLIFSAGRDQIAGIRLAKSYVARLGLPQSQLDDPADPDDWPIILPWVRIQDPDDSNNRVYLGTALPEGGSTDNIHNHLLGRR
jgi:hypothetical protein